MGRTRNILDLAMAGGAIAAIITLTLPQVRQSPSAFQAVSPAQATSTQANDEAKTPDVTNQASTDQENTEIAHFLGIAQFVKNPTEYDWVCDTDCGTPETLQLAKITEASLEGSQMTISYSTSTPDEELGGSENALQKGQLIGTLDSDGTFEGAYQLRSAKGLKEGSVSFTFAADGTAKNATGILKIAQ